MEIGIEIKEKFSLVHVNGDMSGDDLEKLGGAIEMLMKKGYMHVVLDLTDVSSMNAKGLGALVNHWNHVRFKRGDLRRTWFQWLTRAPNPLAFMEETSVKSKTTCM